MLGLILDTSTEKSLLGLINDGKPIDTRIEMGGKNLSKTLFPTLNTLLKETGLKIENLDYIAYGVGPGSYIGMRTAATVARTLSFAQDLSLFPFYSPLAFLPAGINGNFLYVGDAKMQEYFVMKGFVEDGKILKVEAPKLARKAPNETGYTLISPISVLNGLSPTPNLELLESYISIQKKTSLSLAYLR